MVLLSTSTLFAQIAFNQTGANADNSAMLDVQSDSLGMLIPRMTKAQRNAINNPAVGLMVYVIDDNSLWIHDGVEWVCNTSWIIDTNTFVLSDDYTVTHWEMMHRLTDTLPHVLYYHDSIRRVSDGNTWDNYGQCVYSTIKVYKQDSLSYVSLYGNSGQIILAKDSADRSGDPGLYLFSKQTVSGVTRMGSFSWDDEGNCGLAIHVGASSYPSWSARKISLYGGGVSIGNNYAIVNPPNGGLIVEDSTGIGTGHPTEKLHVVGKIRMEDGNPKDGLLLVSDTIGTMHWASPDTISGGGWIVLGDAIYRIVDADTLVAINSSEPVLSVKGTIVETGTGNSVFIGAGAGLNDDCTDNENVFVGDSSGNANTTGIANVACGYKSLYYNVSGNQNTAIGFKTLLNNTTGHYNTALGYQAFNTGTSYENSTAIGYSAQPSSSNTIAIGNTSVTWIGGQVAWSIYSDKRIKDNIREDVPGLDFILKLKPVTYNLNIHRQNKMLYGEKAEKMSDWNEKYSIEQQRMTGFLAQDVAAAAKDLNYEFSGVDIPENEKDLYSLRYTEFVVPLVKAVQEQQEQYKSQTEKINRLEQENTLLKRRLEKLERIINKINPE